jgi:putative flippase GtrA
VRSSDSPVTTTPPAGMVGEPGPLLRVVTNQKVAFLGVGAFNTASATVWFVGWQSLAGEHLGYHANLVAAYLCNVMTAFLLYRFLVFRVRGHFRRDLWRFTAVTFTSFALNLVAMTVAVTKFGFPVIRSQLVITPILALGVYFGYRDFSFRR